MVSNSSSLGDDFGQLGSAITAGAEGVGQFLGLVDDDLIPGDPAATGELAAQLSKLSGAFERAGQGFRKIDTGSWQGQTADAARGHLEIAPPKWLKAGDSFGDAGKAVADYQRVLAEAQQTATRAKADLERAQQASEAARSAHNARVNSYNAAARQADSGGAAPPAPPGAFHDPAAADIAAAQRTIEQAQSAVREAGDRAARVVLAAAEAAPAEPGLMTQLKENLVDSAQAAGRTVGSVVGGAVGAVVDLGKLVRTVAPLDPYKITHPAQAQENMATLAMGVVGAVQNPYGAAKTVVDVDGWKNEPAKTMGACIPDAIASIAGGAGVASRVARSVGKVADHAGDLGRAGRRADDLAGGSATRSPAPPQAPPPGAPHWPDSSPRPATPGQHPGPAAQQPMPRGIDHSGQPNQFGPHGHADNLPRTEQPWRSPDPNTPYPHSERDFAEPPTGRDAHAPETPRQPDPHAHSGPEQPHPERADLPGQEPGRAFEDMQRYVDQHGDPLGFGDHPWKELKGDGDLPKGLADKSVSSYPDADERFLYRDADPNHDPLYRKIEDVQLDEVFENGLSARNPEAPADLAQLGAHMGGGGNPTPFISTTDNLGHALSRDGGFHNGVILDIRDPGGHAIDADATFKKIEGDTFMSHGEGEKAYLGGVPRDHIRGGWGIVDGAPRWFDNPHFDHRILNRSPQ